MCCDLHLCSRMRSFDVYYTMVIVVCQVFVTFFLKKVLLFFSSLLSCLIPPWVGGVSIGAVVLGACWVFVGFGLVWVLGFSLLCPLAWRVRGCGVWLGCLYRVCAVVALWGLLGVWRVSRWGGLR